MSDHRRDQNPDEQVYQNSENSSAELPSDPSPEYDELVEDSFPASDPPSTSGSTADPQSADD